MATLAQKQLITELYVGWFNRVPDAAGLNYWIQQFDNGSSLTAISGQFYQAAVLQFSADTGYTSNMSNDDFITKVYEGVFGRSGSLAPNAEERAYWIGQLNQMNGDKGALVVTMIDVFKNYDTSARPDLAALQDKFDNKVYVASVLAAQQGLNLSIADGKAALAGVTDDAASVATAISLGQALAAKAENDAPVASNSAISVAEDASVAGNVTATDADADALAYTVTTAAAHGAVVIDAATGAYTYTPTANYNGTDSFVVTVADGRGGVTTSTVNLTVTAVNDAPTAANVSAVTAEDNSVTGAVMGADIDGDALAYTLGTAAANGTATVNSNGSFTYVPNANFNGSDTFTVTVADGKGGTATSTVTVSVSAVNDAPVAPAVNTAVLEDAALLSGAVVATDVDAGAVLTYSLVSGVAGLTFNADGTYTFDATNGAYQSLKAGQVTNATATYQVTDGTATASNSITFTVVGTNDTPTASALVASGIEDIVVTGRVAGADVDGDTLTFAVTGPVVGGAVSMNAQTGEFTFTPTANFHGAATFSYTVTDGTATSAAQVVTINFAEVTDNLTTASDDIMGSAGDDLFVAANRELGAGDIINGGAGNDTLVLNIDSAAVQYVLQSGDWDNNAVTPDTIQNVALPLSYSGFQLISIETLRVTNDSGAIATFDLSSATDASILESNNSNNDIIFNNAKAGANSTTTLNVVNLTNAANVTLDLRNGDVAGVADVVNLNITNTDNLNNSASTISIDNGVETVNISTANSTGAVTIGTLNTDDNLVGTADGATTLGMASAVNLTINDALDANVKTVNAGTSTGNLVFDISAANGATNITTGTGSDNITAGDVNDVINAGAGNNTIAAANGNNTITTLEGNDTITSGTGNDVINAGEGNNNINAGAGVNSVTVANGNNTIVTGTGADTVTAGNGANNITTNDGNDVITAGNGGNTIDAGAGNDAVTTGSGADTITIGAGLDSVSAGEGNDIIIGGDNFDASTIGVTVQDSINGGAGRDELQIVASNSTTDADFQNVSSVEILTLNGTAGTTNLQDQNAGGLGYAQLAGIDTININSAANGNDSVDASTFTTALTVNMNSSGNDTVLTGSANDTINGGANITNADSINAGAGTADVLNLSGNYVGAGLGALNNANIDRVEIINLASQTDIAGANTGFSYNLTVNDGNVVDGGVLTVNAGSLMADVDSDTAGNQAETLTFTAAGTTLYAVNVTGGAADDTITGGLLNDTLDGGDGADTLNAGAGTNSINAGAGADTVNMAANATDNINAGAGNDTINVATADLAAADTIDGGEGTDTLVVTGASVDAQYTNASSIETLTFFAGNATLAAQAQEAGIRTVNQQTAATVLDASAYTAGMTVNMANAATATTGSGADIVNGSAGIDNITTNAGNDTVTAGDGNDTVSTGAGDDTVNLGVGDENINLGADNDTLVVTGNQLDAADVVAGGTGNDSISLDNSVGAIIATVDLTNVTGFETIAFTHSGNRNLLNADADNNVVTFQGGNVNTLTTINVNAATVTDTDDTVTINFNNTIDADFAFNVTGSAVNDTFVKATGGANNNISINAGEGNDTLTIDGGDMGANIVFNGEAGTDTINQTGGMMQDDDFVGVSNVERMAGSVNITLGAEADRAFGNTTTTIDMSTGNDDSVVVDAAFDNAITVNGFGVGDDTMNAAASASVLTVNATAANITADDMLRGGTTANDTLNLTADNGTAVLTNMTAVESVVVVESGANNVGMTFANTSFANVASGRISVNATALDDADANQITEGGLTVNAGTVTAGAFDIQAGNGTDNITTGSGDDVIDLGLGNDTVDAGEGNNTITNLDGNKVVTTGSGNDTITLGNGNNVINAGNGTNTVTSGNGNNTVTTGTGVDTITLGNGDNNVTTGAGNDNLTLGSGSNTVVMGAGNDTLTFTAGDAGERNVITMGAGQDSLTLGASQDFLRLENVSDSVGLTQDQVTGFTSGTDRIVVETQAVAAAIANTFSNAPVLSANAYTDASAVGMNFAGNAADFSAAQGAISLTANDRVADYVFEQANNRLWIDVNDDGLLNGLDMQVTLNGVSSLAAGDVILRDTSAPVFAAVNSTITENANAATTTVTGAALTGNLGATDASAVTYTANSALVGTYGTLTLAANGNYTYTPNTAVIEALNVGQTDQDVFTITATDAAGNATQSTYTVRVVGGNDAPVAVADTGAVNEDATVNVAALTGVLANDTDVDTGSTKTVTAVAGVAGNVGIAYVGTYGTLTLNANGSYSYVADQLAADALNQGVTAQEVIVYTMTDDNGATSTANLTITVTGVNDAPVAVADTGAVNEDATVNVAALTGVLANDTDADTGSTKTVTAVAGVAGNVGIAYVGTYGTLTLNANGSYSYVADQLAADALNQGVTAQEVIAYTMTDDNGATSTANLTITVTGVNDAPVAVADTGAVNEDATVNVAALTGVLANDTDADTGSTKTVTAVAGVAGNVGIAYVGTYGTLTLNANGSYSYVADQLAADALNQGVTAQEVIAYTMTDDNGATSTANLTITVTGVNDAPVANLDSVSVIEDATVNVAALTGVLANDTDADTGSTKTVTAVAGVAGNVGIAYVGTYGTLTLNANGSYSYVADQLAADALNQGVTAQEVIAYTMTDDNGATSTANLTITVTGVNDAPVAVADTGAVNEDATVNVAALTGVLANDTDADTGSTKTVTAVAGVAGNVGIAYVGTYGTLTLNANGSYSYVADQLAADALNQGVTAQEVIAYTMTDDNGATSTANLTITVTGVNDAPVAVADTGAVNEDATVNVAALTGVLANDTDADTGSTKTVTAVAGVAGNVGIAYVGTYGTLTLNANGSYSYVADQLAADALNQGVTAQEVIAYTMTDDNGATSTANLTITVTGVNDAPVAVADTGAVNEDATVNVAALTGVLANDTDADTGSTKTVTAVAGVAGNVGIAYVGTYGTLTLNANGSYSYVADQLAADALNQGVTAQEVIAYTMTDDNGATSTANLTITVTGVNDAPVAVADTGAVNEDATVNVAALTGVLANDTDADTGSTKTVTAVAGVAGNVGIAYVGTYGTLTLNANGSYSYVADQLAADALNQGVTAQEVIAYTMTDDNGATSTANLTITVTGVNDAPVAVADTGAVNEDATVNVAALTGVLANDTDADTGSTKTVTAVAGVAGNVGIAYVGTYGTLTLNANGSYSYVADQLAADALNQGVTAQEVIAYTMTDDNGATSTANLTITVTGVNDAPVINSFAATSTGFTINVTDADATGTLSFSGASVAALQGNITEGGATYTLSALATPTQYDMVVTDGTASTDVTVGGSQVSLIIGTNGNDTLNAVAAGNVGVYYGFDGNDTITGGNAADTIFGGAGADVITGGAGADVITGGAGADVFVKEGNTGAAGMDTITDFSLVDGDTINATINGGGTITYVDATGISEATILAILGTNSRAVATGSDATQFYNVNGSGDSIILFDDVINGTWDAAIKLTGVVADVTGIIV